MLRFVLGAVGATLNVAFNDCRAAEKIQDVSLKLVASP